MAENLLEAISPSTRPTEEATESTSTLNQENVLSRRIEDSSSRTRRRQITAACQACRQGKVKCDLSRPCRPCLRREIECVSNTQGGETHSQAAKRKLDETVQTYAAYEEIFHLLQNESEWNAAGIVRQIRSGRDAEMVLSVARAGEVAFASPRSEQLALTAFLINLAHSTGSLGEIAQLATSNFDTEAKTHLPNAEAYNILRNRVVYFPFIETMLRRSEQREGSAPLYLLLNGDMESSHIGVAVGGGAISYLPDISGSMSDQNIPPQRVSARPWTTVSVSDEAVSHLISLFLTWFNPTWRFVEQDLFLQGMRSGNLDSDLCSPFLVNSICAIASLHSEHDVAFFPKNPIRITRGQHFHDEAIRLWSLEEGRASLTNIQALCVLSLESNYRAKDQLGLTLIPIAAQLNNEVPFHANESRCKAQQISIQDFVRNRVATHWAATCTYIIMRLAFMSGEKTELLISGTPDIHETFEDKSEDWIEYPLAKGVVAHRPTLYLRERCTLTGFLEEMHDLIFPRRDRDELRVQDYVSAVDQLLGRMERWRRNLPAALLYQWPMSVAVWELHASYLTSAMIVRSTARNKCLQQDQESLVGSTMANRKQSGLSSQAAQNELEKAIVLAHEAANIVRDFRERYGLKILPAWLLQLQAVTAGILLPDPNLQRSMRPRSPANRRYAKSVIHDSPTAFEEIFRSLLGAGVEVMIARGIARIIFHTALKQKIPLSRSTQIMLQVMADTAWCPTDLALVRSSFPNFADINGFRNSERLTKLLSRLENLEL